MSLEIYNSQVYRVDDFCETYRDTSEVYQVESVQVANDDGSISDGSIIQRDSTSIEFVIYKGQDCEKGLVSGWANVAKNADGSVPLDWQGDVIDPTDLEQAAIDFMLEYRGSGECHEGDEVGTVVESIVLTKDKQEAMGIPEGTVPEGWFITVKLFDDDVIAKVKSGEYKMFSIQGTAERHALN